MRARALSHLAATVGAGKTTFIERLLDAEVAFSICVRAERDELARLLGATLGEPLVGMAFEQPSLYSRGVRKVLVAWVDKTDLRAPTESELVGAAESPKAPEFADIVHRSRVMARLIQRARRVAVRNVPVLIEGESGTGKEMFARAIHRASTRRDRPFIAVNCGAIPAELLRLAPQWGTEPKEDE